MITFICLILSIQCPPKKNTVPVNRFTFDGITYVTCSLETGTKIQEVEYATNLPSHTSVVTVDGTVQTTNTSTHHIIRYEYRIRIKASALRSPVVTELRNFCYRADEDTYVIYSTQEIPPGKTHTFHLDGAIVLGPNPYDLDGDGLVGGSDLGLLFVQWGLPGSADFDNNGVVDGADLAQLLDHWR